MTKTSDYFISEFFGTLILILFGNGSVIVELIYSKTPNILSINIAYGLGVTFGVFVAHRSGGHLNPAVTIQAVVFDKLKPILIGAAKYIEKLIAFRIFQRIFWHLFVLAVIMISAQMLGAFIASGILHFSYKAGLNTESALNKSNEACLDSSPVLASAR